MILNRFLYVRWINDMVLYVYNVISRLKIKKENKKIYEILLCVCVRACCVCWMDFSLTVSFFFNSKIKHSGIISFFFFLLTRCVYLERMILQHTGTHLKKPYYTRVCSEDFGFFFFADQTHTQTYMYRIEE